MPFCNRRVWGLHQNCSKLRFLLATAKLCPSMSLSICIFRSHCTSLRQLQAWHARRQVNHIGSIRIRFLISRLGPRRLLLSKLYFLFFFVDSISLRLCIILFAGDDNGDGGLSQQHRRSGVTKHDTQYAALCVSLCYSIMVNRLFRDQTALW